MRKWLSKQPEITFKTCEANLKNLPHPVRASKKMPSWLKQCPKTITGAQMQDGTIRRCVPFLDAVGHGYILPLWADLLVSAYYPVDIYNDQDVLLGSIYHNSDENDLVGEMVAETGETVARVSRQSELQLQVQFPTDNVFGADGEPQKALAYHDKKQVGPSCTLSRYKFGEFIIKMMNPWTITTKSGWSVHFKNPPAQFDSNIEILEGVVDTDKYVAPINFPCIWKGNEEGDFLIPMGTPLVQIIPFKRHKTKSVVKVEDFDYNLATDGAMSVYHFDRYKRLFWHKRKIE